MSSFKTDFSTSGNRFAANMTGTVMDSEGISGEFVRVKHLRLSDTGRRHMDYIPRGCVEIDRFNQSARVCV
jgi:hypothetical protein